jgi:hypothetical protein
VAARFYVETRFVHMAKTNNDIARHPASRSRQTLLALLHAQGEVARLSERDQLFSSLLDSVNAVLWAFDWETRQVLYVSRLRTHLRPPGQPGAGRLQRMA